MDYENFLKAVEEMDFIESREHADSVIKGVFGILASELDEAHAKILTERLPEPLTMEKLRGMQKYRLRISFDQYLEEISGEFGIARDQAEKLVDALFGMMLESVDMDAFNEIKSNLPDDWVRAMEKRAAFREG